MNPFTTNGAFSWAELMTTDPAAADSFYNSIFGWSSQTAEMSTGPYTVVSTGDTPVGGIMALPEENMPVCWSFYVTVNDIDTIAASAVSLGATLLMPVFEVPTVGKLAAIQDPQGAVFMVIQYEPPSDDKPMGEVDITKSFATHGAMSWVELRTGDMEGAISFYSQLFGWTVNVQDMAYGAYGTISVGEVGIGGMTGLMDENMPPHWGGYITVDDADAAAEAATANGGTVLAPPMDIPGVGRFTMFQDPQGGILAAIKYAEMLSKKE